MKKLVHIVLIAMTSANLALAANKEDTTSSSQEQQITFRLKGGIGSFTKIDPIKSMPGFGTDVDFSISNGFGLMGSILYFTGSETAIGSSTSIRNQTDSKTTGFGLAPRYMVQKSNIQAYAGVFLGYVSQSTDVTVITHGSAATPVSSSSSSFAYGPLFGIDFPIVGAFGMGIQAQYITCSNVAFGSLMAGFSFIF